MDLEQEIRKVYAGSIEEFVRRRDAIARELRGSGRREDADRIKMLRKPARLAAALNAIVHAGGTEVDHLAAAIADAQAAHTAGVDVRAALERVRAAVREVAHSAAREAIRLGMPLEAAPLTTAVSAVIGDAAAFATLRAGCLADIPEAGGLDFLSAIVVAPAAIEAAPAQRAREEAEAALERADHRLAQANGAVSVWEAKLAAAERELERAKQEVESIGTTLADARRAAEAAAATRREASRALNGMAG